MNLFEIIFLSVIILFFLINTHLLRHMIKSFIYSLIGRKYIPKRIFIFNKEVKHKNHLEHFFFKNFVQISWIIIFIIALVLFLPNMTFINEKYDCNYQLITGYEHKENCIKSVEEYIDTVKTPTPSNLFLGEGNNKIIVVGDYDNIQTKKIIEKISEIYKENPEKIKYNYINIKQTEKSEYAMCVNFVNYELFWATHLIFAKENMYIHESLNNITKRLNIDEKKLNNCLNSSTITKEFEKINQTIKESNIFAIPTTFINNQVFIGDFDVEKQLK